MSLWHVFFQLVWTMSGPMESAGILRKGWPQGGWWGGRRGGIGLGEVECRGWQQSSWQAGHSPAAVEQWHSSEVGGKVQQWRWCWDGRRMAYRTGWSFTSCGWCALGLSDGCPLRLGVQQQQRQGWAGIESLLFLKEEIHSMFDNIHSSNDLQAEAKNIN